MKGRTPDEKFLIQLYRTALDRGDPYQEIDCREVMRVLAQKETAVKNIVKHLAQANFIEKLNGTSIRLTPHGYRFVLSELEVYTNREK